MQLLGGWDFTILLQFTLSIPRNQIYILKYEFANKYTVPISILNLLIRHTLIPWFPIRCHWFKFKKFLKNSLDYPTLPVMILPVGVRTVTHLMIVFDCIFSTSLKLFSAKLPIWSKNAENFRNLWLCPQLHKWRSKNNQSLWLSSSFFNNYFSKMTEKNELSQDGCETL